jgi:hypothetical protein
VLKTHAVPIKCTDIALPRFKIGGRWYCLFENRGLSECHEPLNLPVSPEEVDNEDDEKWGLGRSIYSKEQLEAFHEFQMSVAVRAAYVADSSELAFSRRGPGGEWDLGLGQHAQAMIVDLVGLSFVSLYRFLGPGRDNEGGDGDGGATDRYPSLAKVRRREDQCLPWTSWRRCRFRGRDDAPQNSVELEERRLLDSGDAANAPSRE